MFYKGGGKGDRRESSAVAVLRKKWGNEKRMKNKKKLLNFVKPQLSRSLFPLFLSFSSFFYE